MTTETATLRPAAARPPLLARLVGLGSVYGKSVRDGRRAALIVTTLVGVLMLTGGAAMAAEFATREARLLIARQIELLPVVLRGLLGEPIRIDTLGGFLSWRFGNILPIMVGIWSVLALSSTLASEGRRGTLDMVAATPLSRRRIAAEKALAHATLVTLAMVAAALVTWASTIVFASLPGDEVTLGAALGHFALTGLLMLTAGGAAFAVAPLLGRGRALAVGFIVLFGSFLIESYAAGAPLLDALRPLSVFSWTTDHRPLAGQWDWPPLGILALLDAALLGAGVVAFARRDIGIPIGSGPIKLPSLPAGTGGPARRQLSDRLPGALAWGIGIGLYGSIIAASSDAFAQALGTQPQIRELVARLYPGLDLSQPSGVVQLAFFGFGTLLIGLAAAVFVGGWASDESEGRLDLVLSVPISRAGWAIGSGVGLLLGVALVAAVVGLLIGAGVASQGGELAGVVGGTAVLALYGTAFGGVGLLVGGIFGTRFAAAAAGGLVIASFLLELLGNALNLPEWVVDLSPNRHVGQPLVGTYDLTGLGVMSVMVVGGLLLGAWGWTRRDIGR